MSEGRVLVIDDEEVIRNLLKDTLTDVGYEVVTRDSGQKGIDAVASNTYDVVITDIRLPDIDGIHVLESLKKHDPDAVVLVITGYPSFETVRDTLRLGAHDYLTKPFNIEEITFTVKNSVNYRRMVITNKRLVDELEKKNMLLEEQTAILEVRVKERTKNLQKLYEDLRKTYVNTIKALADTIEAKDSYTRSHSDNVTKYAVAIGQQLGLSSKELEEIREASELHDLGKIGIDDYILRKPDKLTAQEWEQVKNHSAKGAQILENLGFLKQVVDLVHHHHERFDGKGYPDGIGGTDIKLGARIIALADSYEAMTSKRPYRKKPLSKEEAIKEIKKNSGTQFDPKVVDAFLKAIDKL